MKKKLLTGLFALLTVGMCNEVCAQTWGWNFSSWSEESIKGVANDYNWGRPSSEYEEPYFQKWLYHEELTYNIGDSIVKLKETEGLKWYGSFYIRPYYGYLELWEGAEFTIPQMYAGQKITLNGWVEYLKCTTSNTTGENGIFVVEQNVFLPQDVTFRVMYSQINLSAVTIEEPSCQYVNNLLIGLRDSAIAYADSLGTIGLVAIQEKMKSAIDNDSVNIESLRSMRDEMIRIDSICNVGMLVCNTYSNMTNCRTDLMNFIDSLAFLGLNTLRSEYKDRMDSVKEIDETSVDAIKQEAVRLDSLLTHGNDVLEYYIKLPDLITECDSLDALRSYYQLGVAVSEAKSLMENKGNIMSDEIVNVYNKINDLRSVWYARYEDTDKWSFRGNRLIGDYEVSFDYTHKVACVEFYRGEETEIVMPDTIIHDNIKYQVVGLGGSYEDVFYDSINGNHIWSHGVWAKSHSVDGYLLKSVVLPRNLRFIRYGAFDYCRGLESLEIPEYVTKIGNRVFDRCSELTELIVKAEIPPVCDGPLRINDESGYSGIAIAFVPEESGDVYWTTDHWKDLAIVAGPGVNLEISLATPGLLGELILEKTDYLRNVNQLKIVGNLNSEDYYSLNRLLGLIEIDMSGVNTKTVPYGLFKNRRALRKIELPSLLQEVSSEMFQYCSNLRSVELPNSVKRIGSNAFYGCARLVQIEFPDSLSIIYSSAFSNCNKLQFDSLPENLKTIQDCAFEYCYSLKQIELPTSLKTIGAYAFTGCYNLCDVTFNEGLDAIHTNAFAYTALQEVVLPASLQCCIQPFIGCDKLKKVTSLALFPPYPGSEKQIYSADDGNYCILYVPSWTINKYKLTGGWDEFYPIEPLNICPNELYVCDELKVDLKDSVPVGYKPNLSISYFSSYGEIMENVAGSLYLKGNDTLSLKNFSMYQSRYDNYAEWENYWGYTTTSVLLNEATIEADNVITDLELSSGHWHFLSFPYDVKVSDIKTSGDWVIRYYDGAARAKMDYNNTWVTVPYDGVLRAGQGYIWSSSNGSFTVPALDNENKNLIFANDTRRIPLEEYLSDYTSNNSWNLIGNPFPCYYDTRYMEYTAPITVWDRENRTYVAYSPVDDNYILTPLEAFFVQCPTGVDSVGFKADGRQTNTAVRTIPVAATAGVKSAPRQVFNVLLSNEQYTDRTRFVINGNAQRTYEMNCDAAKFMSSDAKAPQLFTVEGDDKLAINERPLADGKVALGVYVGSAGTYTLSLETSVNQEVTLIDHLTGEEVDMTTESYTFEAEVGTVDGRFTLLIGDGEAYSVDEAVAEGVKVLPVAGGISVSAADGVEVVLYNAAGAQVGTGSGASVRFNVAPGLYVVKVGNTSYKVSVNK